MQDNRTLPAILAIATGVPSHRFSQDQIYEFYSRMQGSRDRRARAIFHHAGVSFRHTIVGNEYYDAVPGTAARNERYMVEAIPLGEATIRRCLEQSGRSADAIDDFIVISCTGVSIPGLDLHLAGRLGMRSDLRRTCVLGMGCYAAFPGLLRARESAASDTGRVVLVLAIELCSLHLQLDNTIENAVATALFADGAAAALIGDGIHTSHNGTGTFPQPRLLDSATFCDYQTLDQMAFCLTDHGFQMHLSSYVPDVLAANVEPFVDSLLGKNGLSRRDVRFWGVHPGSGKILDYLQSRLGLPPDSMDYSRTVLRDYGNMSSPTILFVLDEIHRSGQPAPGDYGVLLAFGPGLTMEGALIRW